MALRGEKMYFNNNGRADFTKDVGFFVVADGMGGHSFGEKASAAMVSGLGAWWKSVDKNNMPGMIDLALILGKEICNVSGKVYDYFESIGNKGGCTVCAMIIVNNSYIICNVGDSRAYYFDKELKRLTTDDIWDNMEEVKAALSPEQRLADKRHGQLTQAAGYDMEISPRILRGFLNKGADIIICTDGIYKFCPESELTKILKGSFLGSKSDRKLDNIVSCVRENGARDNYSAILIELQ